MRHIVFDRFIALLAIVILSPLLLAISIAIAIDSRGGVFFVQTRIGKEGRAFGIIKFRSMLSGAERQGKLTIGSRDRRVTHVGYWLRKHKLDELPQLFNVLNGTMNLVGPRPEVPEYVAMYNSEQLKVLDVKPGITDYASLQYFDESELLYKSTDPKKTYIEEIMPAKLKLNMEYLRKNSFLEDCRIIGKTIMRILRI